MKSLFEEAKRISFNISIVSIIILFSLILYRSSDVDHALKDLKFIKTYFSSKDQNYFFNKIVDYINSELAKKKIKNQQFQIIDNNKVISFGVKSSHANWMFNNSINLLDPNSVLTLQQIKVFWNQLDSNRKLKVITLNEYYAKYDNARRNFFFQKLNETKNNMISIPIRDMDFLDISDSNWINKIEVSGWIQKNSITPKVLELLLNVVNDPNVHSRYYLFGSINPLFMDALLVNSWNFSTTIDTNRWRLQTENEQLKELNDLFSMCK